MFGYERKMPRGLGFVPGSHSGHGRAVGFGFRGVSPPWPYSGRGRGGLPRCRYSGLEKPVRFNEREILRNQADMMRSQLKNIERRLNELKD